MQTSNPTSREESLSDLHSALAAIHGSTIVFKNRKFRLQCCKYGTLSDCVAREVTMKREIDCKNPVKIWSVEGELEEELLQKFTIEAYLHRAYFAAEEMA